ncbi:hypothetical protein APR04_000546 [Promicromonospora umidemergens]|uniref:ESAT-6 protein secretion system EspG family protein n=1 Tax=Promicromonospora umidemergens TaxID=629679 RepID=A0ABP8X9F1_9MICO|nr:hypothetical protein [Promicromonospora umidemergens]MCP2281657.1 hypothetical protein [Promicromonospora umidemergens]
MQHVDHIAAADPAIGKPTDKWAFLLPPGWARFPTGAARRRELDRAVDQVVAGTFPEGASPVDVESHRQALRDSLRQAFSAAGTGAVYVPTEPMAGIAIPASIIETELFGLVGRSATEVAASVLGDAKESTAVDVDGRPGVRLASTLGEAPHPAGRPVAGTRQVTYVVARDEAGGDWLVLSFSAVWSDPGTERLAEVLVDFFDAVMATFRWTGPGADPVGLPDRTVPGSAWSEA